MFSSTLPVTEDVVRACGLRKRYADAEVLRGIDLRIRRGEIFAFLGPNGAGKTTTLEILEGFLRPSAGEVSVLGADPAEADRRWRERIGIVLQESRPEPGLTVRESLELYAGYYEQPRDVDRTLELVDLTERSRVPADTLSGGELRRLDVALALIGDPDLLFLDEPTTGFDPSARRSAWAMIEGLRSLGKTIFLTTHYMEEAERLADRVAVIAGGRIVADGPPGSIGGHELHVSTIRFTLPDAAAVHDLPAVLRPEKVGPDGAVTLRAKAPLNAVHTLAEWALPRGLDLADLEIRRPLLEDVYLSLTNGSGEA